MPWSQCETGLDFFFFLNTTEQSFFSFPLPFHLFLHTYTHTHRVEMLQTACMTPELLVNQNMSESEICGYSPGQGSPLPGETASPKSCFQQSPSLPDSGLTELNVASPKIYHPPPPCKPPGMPAPAGKRKLFIPISCSVLLLPADEAQ